MRTRFLSIILLLLCFFPNWTFGGINPWKKAGKINMAARTTGAINATDITLFTCDMEALQAALAQPNAGSPAALTLDIPGHDGTFYTFTLRPNGLLPAALQEKYPEIRTFSGEMVGNAKVTAAVDITAYGFHAMVFDGDNTFLIDPEVAAGPDVYSVHLKKDEIRNENERGHCLIVGGTNLTPERKVNLGGIPQLNFREANGWVHKNYRLAVACDNQYATAVAGASATVSQVLSKMVTTMNRVNGIYERELSVSMTFVPNEDVLLFLNPATDPLGAYNQNATLIIDRNQVICDSLIGTANYDIGHVFTTGGGGLSSVGAVCSPSFKAHSVTGNSRPYGDGYDVDYVSHEMGHEFGAQHTFNNSASGDCDSQGSLIPEDAYEPGSGSTIMAYAGICGPDNLQPHSNAYFHAASLIEIKNFITNTALGGSCAVNTPTGNKLVYLPAWGTKTNTIPTHTPFEITAPVATDSVADTLTTYCWEQWNLGDAGATFANTHAAGPIFRSYLPVTSPSRTFPTRHLLMTDTFDNSGINNNEGEKLPDVPRYLTFKLTVRNILNGYGCFLIPDDTVHIDVINTGDTFKVTEPTGFREWVGGTNHDIGWKVAGTDQTPFNADSVDISMSGDEGRSYPYYLGRHPNNGRATVFIPDIPTDSFVRVKVQPVNQIFFSVNDHNLLIRYFDSSVEYFPTWLEVGPNPTKYTLHVSYYFDDVIHIVINDVVGRKLFSGDMNHNFDLDVSTWAKGIYFARFYNSHSKQRFVKKILVE